MTLPKGTIIEKNIIPEFIQIAFLYLDENFDDSFKSELFFILGENKC